MIKPILFIALIMSLVLVGGCSEYKCKIGTKQGDNCYTEPTENHYFEGVVVFHPGEQKIIEQVFDDGWDLIKQAPSGGVIQETEILNITNLQINDTKIMVIPIDNGVLENLANTEKTVFISFEFTRRYRRPIWEFEGQPYLTPDIEEYGGEVSYK